MRPAVRLLPKEHGAYGQIVFPLVTAFAVAGASTAGAMTAVATVAGFLAHEPAAVMLGHRGPRARRELGGPAARWLGCSAAIGIPAAAAALFTMPVGARWSLMVPLLPAGVLALATFRGREKLGYGEVASALAFAGVAIPIALAAGRPNAAAFAIAIPFAVLFVAGTLAVRVVILRVRGGGDVRAAASTRRAAFAVAGGVAGALAWAVNAALLPVTVLIAAAPGLAIPVVIAARPPAPARLRVLGWALVAASVLAAVATIAGAGSY